MLGFEGKLRLRLPGLGSLVALGGLADLADLVGLVGPSEGKAI